MCELLLAHAALALRVLLSLLSGFEALQIVFQVVEKAHPLSLTQMVASRAPRVFDRSSMPPRANAATPNPCRTANPHPPHSASPCRTATPPSAPLSLTRSA